MKGEGALENNTLRLLTSEIEKEIQEKALTTEEKFDLYRTMLLALESSLPNEKPPS